MTETHSDLLTFADLNGNLLDGLDFCSKVYVLFEKVRAAEDGVTRLRKRPKPGVEKKLLEELLPICSYIQASYRVGRYISVKWFDGSQPFDAELIQSGAYISSGYFPETGYLEVTCAVHPNEHLSRELLESKGGGFGLDGMRRLKGGEIESVPVVYTNGEFIESYCQLLLQSISKKAGMTYPKATTLIVQCTLNNLYMPDEWRALVDRAGSLLPPMSFQEVFLYDPICNYSHSFHIGSQSSI